VNVEVATAEMCRNCVKEEFPQRVSVPLIIFICQSKYSFTYMHICTYICNGLIDNRNLAIEGLNTWLRNKYRVLGKARLLSYIVHIVKERPRLQFLSI
jgi:hypothetical protein